MNLHIDQVCQGIYEHIPPEDVVGCIERDTSILAWAIDGVSTLTESSFTTFDTVTDSGWFARRLARTLETRFRAIPFDRAVLAEELPGLREEYLDAGGAANPLWSWPAAAAVFAEISLSGDGVELTVYQYADCFAATLTAPLLSGAKTTVLRPVYDVWKPASGFQGAELERLRQNRHEQQQNRLSTALTLNPASAANGSETRRHIATPVHILLGSDGLSRIWDTYHLMSSAQAMELLARQGLPALLAVLRTFEATTPTGSPRLKRRDDACGIHLHLR